VLIEAPAAPVDSDVWSVLKSGNGEKARGFFTGEVDVHAVDSDGMTPLHYAADNRDSQLATFFIAMGAEVDALDKQGRTPLAISALKKDGPTTQTLVAGGADIFHTMPGGTSPAAIALADSGLLSALLKTPATITATDTRGKTLLDLALERPDSQAHMLSAEKLILAGSYSAEALFPYLAPAVRSSNYNIRIADGITPLHFAARQGYTGLIAFLLDKDVDVNVKTAAGSTPLHEAAMSGTVPSMEMLIRKGADVNAQDANGNSVMHIAIPPASHQAALALLLANGANPNLRDEYGNSPLHIVITLNRDPAIVATLLQGGADVSIRTIDGKTPLYLAIEEGKSVYIPLLLQYRSDIFAADNGGLTPFEKVLKEKSPLLPLLITPETVVQSDGSGNTVLHIALKNAADVEIVKTILDKGALVNARNKEGDTGLHLVVRQNNEAMGALLLSRGADIFAPNSKGESPLYLAFFSPGGRVRQWLLTPETLSVRDGLGNTALHYAAQWKLDQYIPLMVSLGADVEAQNATGEPPLFTAVKYNSPSTIRVLLTSGASIDQRDKLGNTALHAAVRWNGRNAGAALISAGIDINAHALNGKTALHDAVRLSVTDLELLLTTNKADIDIRDAEGNTPLMEAIAGSSSALAVASAERLAALGADVSTRNAGGDTPLHLAVKMDRSDLAASLLKLGASIHARNAQGQTPFRLALVTSPALVTLLLSQNRVLLADDDGLSPLHVAIRDRAPLPMVQAIIDQKARLSAIDAAGKTPLRLALDQENWSLATLLAEAGSDVFSEAGDGRSPSTMALDKGKNAITALFSGVAIAAKDRSGNTILHYAAQYGTLDEVSQLLGLGADIAAKNISGDTPADVAARWKRPDIANALK
jgi:ankyrin repeat protein